MTLANFLDASYALLVEEYQRLDPLRDFVSVGEKLIPPDEKLERAPTADEVDIQNQQSLAQLSQMLKGVR